MENTEYPQRLFVNNTLVPVNDEMHKIAQRIMTQPKAKSRNEGSNVNRIYRALLKYSLECKLMQAFALYYYWLDKSHAT